ncbi:MAG: 4-hydroxy-tetrahydrodipicolinate reductase [Gammaproteobacteria bacterium RIFCSPHIGHO2_02_FULL_39_13]|nr:MAG: 4-hydroxy-tetrahydrodipicolinate reductase [Gammaproteobacteria bacterium RIFCSPHIGHO2_02_FULL_39_13]OGT49685.1 MAG: 4-hydroxy-tetrahydrodipicolinate reductase [Gammaproteobacteria bacterium RIFCSPHIGHO2_12_FULL_39_24]
MNTIKILINGANGKMGRVTVAAITAEKDLRLVATTSRNDDLLSAIQKHKPDIVIDWTIPSAVFENTQKIISAGVRPVIGTSGLTPEQIEIISQQCAEKKIGGIVAPNFSIGAILMMKYAQDAANYFPDVEIIEYHHPKKLDAPSNTAKKTAELLSKIKKEKNTSHSLDTQLKNNLSRGEQYHHIPIHAVRVTGVFANQEVIFGGNGETFTIQHNVTDRSAMMPGLFLCCRKVMELDRLVCGMEKWL